jgi:hypothetical protein
MAAGVVAAGVVAAGVVAAVVIVEWRLRYFINE